MHGHRLHQQTFSCVHPTSHISFWISFKLRKWLVMAEIWPPYSFGSPGIKVMLWGVKNIKNIDFCLCSSFLHDADIKINPIMQDTNFAVDLSQFDSGCLTGCKTSSVTLRY